MKTLIVGDVHNEFGRLNALISSKKPDLVIACGDFGFWPGVDWATPLSNLRPQGSKILWCDGNHENHWAIRDRKSDEMVPDVIYMPRGSTYQLEDGRTILFMGGAHSIDKHWRKIGIDWFPEEIITQKDLMDLPDVKVDIFITHTCPAELVTTMLPMYPEKALEPSNEALSELWKIYKPDLWFFGHWHHFHKGVMMGTKWYALGCPGLLQRWWMWLDDAEKGGIGPKLELSDF